MPVDTSDSSRNSRISGGDIEKHDPEGASSNPSPTESFEPEEEEQAEEPHGSDREGQANGAPIRKWDTGTSTASSSRIVVGFSPNDPEDPYNWSSIKKALIVVLGVFTVLNSTLGSSLPNGDIEPITKHFGVTSTEQRVLPTSIYLIGYIIGPVVFGPLSESYGRRTIMIGTFLGFLIFSIAICWAPNWAAFNVFRLIQGIFASSPISVTGGLYADLYRNPISRGRSMALFMTATTWGPISAPIAAGYLSKYGWQWTFFFALIFAGVTTAPLLLLPETYGPKILQDRARKLRKQHPDQEFVAPLELEKTSARDIFVQFLGRPFRMLFLEALVGFSVLYLSLIYAIFYLFFPAFAIIYPSIYGFSPGEEGLAFVGIGIGALFACAIYLWWDSTLSKAKKQQKRWANTEEYRRLPLACIGGPFFAISLFWVGWSARPSVHWIVPILGGIPFGTGFLLLFMALLNYMVDAYEIFAASALAAASCARSLFGAVLPFAGTPMYLNLGIAWASSLLGFMCLAMMVIPFVFIRYGDSIRRRSKFCQELAEIRMKREAAEEKRLRREARRKAREQGLKPEEAV